MRSLREGIAAGIGADSGAYYGASLREKIAIFFRSPIGMGLLALLLLIVSIFVLLRVRSFFKSTDLIRNEVRIMNPETGQLRWIRVGDKLPEGFYAVEYCFNKQCGPLGGTPVVLNGLLGRPDLPTSCTVCDAPVVAHNPRPEGYETARPKDWNR